MKYQWILAGAAMWCGVACCTCGKDVKTPGTGSPSDSWVPLFNGRDLTGWEIENGAKFSVRNEMLFVDRGTGWLRSTETFADFDLHLEFRFLEPKANSGIFVRTGPTSLDDENGWPDDGYQVQCMDNLGETRAVATMIPYGAEGFDDDDHKSDFDAIRKAYLGPGEWNVYDIACVGDQITVRLNGVEVTWASDVRNPSGHVGIQAEHGQVEFRDLRVRNR